MVRPEVPTNISPVSEVELLVFAMDGSGSMADTSTPDGRRKADHLFDIVKGVLNRLSNSSKRDSFRISLVYFSDNVTTEKFNGSSYFTVNDALKTIKNPLDVTQGGSTAIADTLSEINKILDEFMDDEGLPDKKAATIFLFTDGCENVHPLGRDGVIKEANKIKTHPLSPTLATISFGIDADEDLLKNIASKPNDRQIRHLDIAKVLSELPDPDKLFIQGHTGSKEIVKRKIDAIRNFVDTLSMTRD